MGDRRSWTGQAVNDAIIVGVAIAVPLLGAPLWIILWSVGSGLAFALFHRWFSRDLRPG